MKQLISYACWTQFGEFRNSDFRYTIELIHPARTRFMRESALTFLRADTTNVYNVTGHAYFNVTGDAHVTIPPRPYFMLSAFVHAQVHRRNYIIEVKDVSTHYKIPFNYIFLNISSTSSRVLNFFPYILNFLRIYSSLITNDSRSFLCRPFIWRYIVAAYIVI